MEAHVAELERESRVARARTRPSLTTRPRPLACTTRLSEQARDAVLDGEALGCLRALQMRLDDLDLHDRVVQPLQKRFVLCKLVGHRLRQRRLHAELRMEAWCGNGAGHAGMGGCGAGGAALTAASVRISTG